MTTTELTKRQRQILQIMAGGRKISVGWYGSNDSGYLSHRLEGINRLREAEFKELRRLGFVGNGESGVWQTLYAVTDAGRAALGETQ